MVGDDWIKAAFDGRLKRAFKDVLPHPLVLGEEGVAFGL